MNCDICGGIVENPHLVFSKFNDFSVGESMLILDINEDLPSAQCLCDECKEKTLKKELFK